MGTRPYEQLGVSVIDTYRLHAYADMFAEMQRILAQARSESAWWPRARCRAILADLRKVMFKVHRRWEADQLPYTVWDVSFGALLNPFWQSLHSQSGDEEWFALNVQVWRARLFVDALTPLLRAAQTMENVSEVMDQLEWEGSTETDDPNPVGVDG